MEIAIMTSCLPHICAYAPTCHPGRSAEAVGAEVFRVRRGAPKSPSTRALQAMLQAYLRVALASSPTHSRVSAAHYPWHHA